MTSRQFTSFTFTHSLDEKIPKIILVTFVSSRDSHAKVCSYNETYQKMCTASSTI